ncbi:MAG TPA: acyl-CoA dehydrogenase family protein [Acidimicrobiales bacterium]
MDFTFSEQQRAIAELAGTILADRCPPEALRELERTGTAVASRAWEELAKADLVGLALPVEDGGSGLGVIEACLVAEQVGRHVATVPYWPATAAALAVARWGSPGLGGRLLPGAVDGARPLAVALWAPGAALFAPPATTARRDGDGWRLDGVRSPVPWATGAAALLVPARTDGEVAVFAVDADADGVEVVDEHAISHEPVQTVALDGVRVDGDARLGAGGAGNGGNPLAWLTERVIVLGCATVLGVVQRALELTARHVTEREQFGGPIGTFQAVAHRCADAYIDTEAIRLTTLQAAWRLDAGLDARDQLAIAALWAAEGGQRVVHAAQHLHGGLGVDTDYPLHRYFRWAKVIELLIGGADGSLARLGASLARSG